MKIHAKSKNQFAYLRAIAESDVTICYGPAGSGKSFLAVGLISQWLEENKISNVLVCRSIIGCDGEIGALPGTLQERHYPYFQIYHDYFKQFLGKSAFEKYWNSTIRFYPVELLRGQNYHDCVLVLDEAQNCTPRQVKLFLSRMGTNSKALVIGDNRQSDLDRNGLDFCIKKLDKVKGVSVVGLDYNDIQRSGILKHILPIFDNEGI